MIITNLSIYRKTVSIRLGIYNATGLVLSLHVIKHFEQGIWVSNSLITLQTKLLFV